MSETKWTPGPWRVELDTTLIWDACNPDDLSSNGMGYPIVECRITPHARWAKGPDEEAGIANAHLITAAPKLYEALVEARTALVNERDNFYDSITTSDGNIPEPADGEVLAEMDRLIDVVDTALAAARGENA